MESDLIKQEEHISEKKHIVVDVNEQIKVLIQKKEKQVHPIWGELMKVGLEKSRFAKQVLFNACLYTSKVSNLRYYSPYKNFLSFHDKMPHDR